MNTTVAESRHVLVVEPDPARAAALEEMLRPSLSFHLEIVANADEAMRAMARELPHLLMTSTFLSPADVAAVTGYVCRMSRGWRLPIVDLPFFNSDVSVISKAPRFTVFTFGFLRRRSVVIRPRADEGKRLREHIEQYLQQAVTEPEPLTDRLDGALMNASAHSLWLVPAPAGNPALVDRGSTPYQSTHSAVGQRFDRRRARRRRLEDLPSRWQLKLPGASNVAIVNISTSGVLLETGTQIVPGSILDLQILGQDRNLNVPARMVRTEIAGADVMGARYRVAATFARELEVLESDLRMALGDNMSLARTLERVSAEIDRASMPVAVAAGL
jgi:CheY-like chemotaxis protein